jgi:hypothetical protein
LRSVRSRAFGGAPALLHGLGEAEPSREEEIGRMLGTQHASDAVLLEHEVDLDGDWIGC